ncbi:MAG: DNA starvation/stationary phase protection protein [Candidatus Dependentiae bacterium]
MKKNLFCLVFLAQMAIAQDQALNSSVTIEDVPMGKSEELVNIGLNEAQRKDVAQRLNTLLADEYTLYIKTQKFHWNVVGPFFGSLHKLFNKQYDQLAANVDLVAERVRALGFKAYGSLAEFIENTNIPENPDVNPSANMMIKLLLEGHESIIKNLRELVIYTVEINDTGTNNFVSDLIEKHEKAAWMLRAHLLGQ